MDTLSPFEISLHKDRIESALVYSGGTHTYEDIVRGIEENKYQLWPGLNATVLTEIIVYPQKRIIHCFLAAGDLREIGAIRTWAEEWARREGIDAVTLTGRPGWEKVLANDGYVKASVSLEKDLKEAPDGEQQIND